MRLIAQTMRWSLVSALLFAIPYTAARSEYSSAEGSPNAGKHAAYHACPNGHWMIGMEFKYGNVGIGKARAACRKLAENGSWAGSTVYTSWSSNDSNAESSNHKSANCPSGYVVYGFSTQIGGPNIRRILIRCVKAGPGGLTSTKASSSWVGVIGTPGAFHGCAAGKAAVGFEKRAASMLTYLRFNCSAVQTQQAGLRDVTIPGIAIYNLAKNFGFKLKAQLMPGPATDCSVQVRNGHIVMETAPGRPRDATCRFQLFADGPALKNNWKLRGATVKLSEGSGCKKHQFATPISPSSSLLISYLLSYIGTSPNLAGTAGAPLCIAYLESVTLRGPSNQDWKEAF